MTDFSQSATVPAHVRIRDLNGESVLLNLQTERYFGLDEMGTRMWQLVTTSANIDSAYQKLLEEFDVEPQLLRTHLAELLVTLAENGLLQLQSSNVGTTPAL